MRERQEQIERSSGEIIAAFDKERDRAHELRRQFTERLRESRLHDRAIYIERRRRPR